MHQAYTLDEPLVCLSLTASRQRHRHPSELGPMLTLGTHPSAQREVHVCKRQCMHASTALANWHLARVGSTPSIGQCPPPDSIRNLGRTVTSFATAFLIPGVKLHAHNIGSVSAPGCRMLIRDTSRKNPCKPRLKARLSTAALLRKCAFSSSFPLCPDGVRGCNRPIDSSV